MRPRATVLVALALTTAGYWAARPPILAPAELDQLARPFQFRKIPLAEAPGAPAHRPVRTVHPSLERIAAWVSSVGAAASVGDLDGDGLANDIVLVDPRTDRVTLLPAPVGPERYRAFALDASAWTRGGHGANTLAPTGTVIGDFNEDGHLDLLVYFWGRTPLLYFRIPERPWGQEAFAVADLVEGGERWYTDCATQADLDGDGHLDLLIGNYFQDGARILDPGATGVEVMHRGKAKALNGGFKHVFLWRDAAGGDHPTVRYREVPDAFREEVSRGWTVALGAADLDGDLLPEIYFAHDFGPDRLLHNRSTPGRLAFAELEGRRGWFTPKSCVLGRDSFKGMGCDFGDINGDGHLDIYVSNIATRFGLTESHFVWQSTGEPGAMAQGAAPFVQNSEPLGLSRSGFAWDARLADFDNDGIPEAVQACGFIKGAVNRWPELQALGTSNDQIVHNPRFWPSFRVGTDLSGSDANPFFVRAGAGRYYDVAPRLGLAEPMVSRGLAIADVDGDGRLDFVCANQWGPSVLVHNEAARPGTFLGLRLLRDRGSPAIGATATVTRRDGRRLVAQVDGGSGHSGRRSPELHFGLGAGSGLDPVRVDLLWRDSTGAVRESRQDLVPGWHTIQLTNPPPGAAVASLAIH
ncbi:MAG: CRTAC1 family protein [Verrucomicrobia bacterium]|nr:CRTAC1 family protein [Verrucomicrobiota bacterium]